MARLALHSYYSHLCLWNSFKSKYVCIEGAPTTQVAYNTNYSAAEPPLLLFSHLLKFSSFINAADEPWK